MKRLAPALLVVAAAVILYRKAMRLWWTFDDPGHLQYALTHAWTDALAMPRPLLRLSRELLLAVFGFDAARWYAAQIALVALAGVALWLLLRLFTDAWSALGGAVIFVAGPALCVLATRLGTMDAVVAVVLASVATMLYALAFRRRSLVFEIASAAVYFLAMTASAWTMPLPIALLFLPAARLPVVLRHLLFHLAAWIAWAIWQRPRWIEPSTALLTTLAGEGVLFALVALALMAIGIARLLRDRARLAASLGGLAAAGLAALTSEHGAIALWLWLVVTFTLGAAALSISPRAVLLVVAAAAVIVANRQEWAAESARAMRMSDEARAFITLDGASLLRKPAVPPDTLAALRTLKETHFRRAHGTGWFYDDLYLCTHILRGRHIFEYHDEAKRVVEVTARIPDLASAYCGAIRDDVPLRAEFHYADGTLSWRLGPHTDGTYRLIVGEGVEAWKVRRHDSRDFGAARGVSLRVRYDSPDGWTTYSPEIPLDFAKQPDFTWNR